MLNSPQPATAFTLRELFDAYMQNHARIHCKCWQEFERMFELYLAHWADRPAAEIRKVEVLSLLTGYADKPATANKIRQLISAMYNKGAAWELVTNNPAAKLPRYKVKPRERFLKDDEFARFFAAVATLKNKDMQDLILMFLLTGARRENVSSMQWANIDLQRKTWYIPDTKNGTSQLLPLTTFAVQILERRKQYAKNDWVFPSDGSLTGYITKPERAWKNVLKRAGLQGVRMHDLRRTLASYEAMTGANLTVIMHTLNHKDYKSVQTYARLQTDTIRGAMETAANEMFRHAPGEIGEEANAARKPSVEERVAQAHAQGLKEGRDNGWQEGFDVGTREGFKKGYEQGCEEGFRNGVGEGAMREVEEQKRKVIDLLERIKDKRAEAERRARELEQRQIAECIAAEHFNVETPEEMEAAVEIVLSSMAANEQPQNVKDAYAAWEWDCSDDYAIVGKFSLTGQYREDFLDYVAVHRDVDRICHEAGDDSFEFEMEAHERAKPDRSLLRGRPRSMRLRS